MGKRGPKPGHQSTAVSARVAPVMKYQEACHLADKTSRTIVKISQLLEVTHKAGYEAGDPNKVVEKYIDKLKKRVNRRLQKLAKWSDSSNEDRNAEFRNVPRGAPIGSKLYAFSKPATSFLPPLVQHNTSAGSFAGAGAAASSSSLHRTGSANTSNGNIAMMTTTTPVTAINSTVAKPEVAVTAEKQAQETSEDVAKADSTQSVADNIQPTAESTEEKNSEENQEEPEQESKEEAVETNESNEVPQESSAQPPATTDSTATEEVPVSETTQMDCE